MDLMAKEFKSPNFYCCKCNYILIIFNKNDRYFLKNQHLKKNPFFYSYKIDQAHCILINKNNYISHTIYILLIKTINFS